MTIQLLPITEFFEKLLFKISFHNLSWRMYLPFFILHTYLIMLQRFSDKVELTFFCQATLHVPFPNSNLNRFKTMQDSNLFVIMANSNGNLTSARFGKDLHLFVPDELNLKVSLDHFHELYSSRTWRSREYWLLDITHLGSAEKWLKDLPTLDLDDNLYLFEQENEEVRIWELYQIHSNMSKVIQMIGSWSGETSLKISESSKYMRRKDLKVIHINQSIRSLTIFLELLP